MSLRQRFFKGLISGIGGTILKMALNVVFVPVIISYLGTDYFGFYTLLIVLTETLITLDLGLTAGLIHTLATSHTTAETTRNKEYLFLGQCLYGFLAILLIALGILISPLASIWLNLHGELSHIAHVTFMLVFLDAGLNLYGGYYRAILMSHSLYHLTNMAEIVQTIVCNFLSFGLLIVGKGLVEIFIARLLVSVAINSFMIYKAGQVQSNALCPGFHFNISSFKNLFIISVNSMITKVCALLAYRSDNIIIAGSLGVGAVSIYSLVTRVFGQIPYLTTKISEGIFPVFLKMDAQSDQQSTRQFFLRTSCFLSFFTSVLLICSYLYYPFIFNFLSKGRVAIAPTMPVVYAIIPIIWTSAMISPAGNLLFARKRFQYQTTLIIIASLLNFGLSILFVNIFGVVGVVLGSICAHFSSHQFLIIPKACRELGLSYIDYFKEVHLANGLSLVVCAVSISVFRLLLPESYLSMALIVIVSLILSSLVWLYTSASKLERNLVLSRFQALKNRLRPANVSSLSATEEN
jgi:O-antigen/teichoic acid export membrane protein